jgi:hypothetical protein
VGLEHDELVRLYGPWAGRTPRDAAALFHGYDGLWWMAGGWSLEAFTGASRRHDDCDPCVLRTELPLLRHHLAGRLDLWAEQRLPRALAPGRSTSSRRLGGAARGL